MQAGRCSVRVTASYWTDDQSYRRVVVAAHRSPLGRCCPLLQRRPWPPLLHTVPHLSTAFSSGRPSRPAPPLTPSPPAPFKGPTTPFAQRVPLATNSADRQGAPPPSPPAFALPHSDGVAPPLPRATVSPSATPLKETPSPIPAPPSSPPSTPVGRFFSPRWAQRLRWRLFTARTRSRARYALSRSPPHFHSLTPQCTRPCHPI